MKKNALLYTLLVLLISLNINAAEQKKINFAVLGLKNGTGVTSGETDILADRLRVNLFRTGRVNMMERSQMDEILKEQGFQASGACNDAECAVEMGQMLGVERVVGGSIGKLGSLFLVNLRVIDVQTAKILTVVSKDIAGGIEGVVKFLPDLAEELVKDPKGEGAPVKMESVAEEQPPEVEVEEKPEIETEKQETVTAAIVTEDTEFSKDKSVKKGSNGKNKNRSGVRFSYLLFPGSNYEYYYYDDSDLEYKLKDDLIDEEYLNNAVNNSDLLSNPEYNEFYYRVNLAFMIPIGSMIAIDVGPAFAYYKKQYSYSYRSEISLADTIGTYDWRLKVISPNISLGLNYTKRFHPVKINAGFIVDINFNIVSTKQEDDMSIWNGITYSDYTDKYSDIAFAVGASFGPRIGAEILLGKKLSLGIDYIFKYNKVSTDIDFVSDYDQKWKIKMPSSAFMFSFNIYK